ncbi:hypothetical protein K443DRAFT_512067 [Laccaria amethystina LaAM-08-1]|uniref:Unplaced genomic scaffold K443scaffold_54, whole genome shotgun sequence n=1 Tax=Laccaria amethystina LaAM-08-1 TaxID=1095629 RepID=A0A0C9XMA4_9AGAR|nr:hypothetical protein K443DRAFT_512067 [Laccaria amethystina LaAM-08-1]
MAFDQTSAASGNILASTPNDFKHLSKKLIEITNVQSLTSVAPSPPVIIPETLPMPSSQSPHAQRTSRISSS